MDLFISRVVPSWNLGTLIPGQFVRKANVISREGAKLFRSCSGLTFGKIFKNFQIFLLRIAIFNIDTAKFSLLRFDFVKGFILDGYRFNIIETWTMVESPD